MADEFDRVFDVRVLVAPMAISPVASFDDGTKSDGVSLSSPVIMWLNAALDDSVCEAVVTMISVTAGFYSKTTAADAPPTPVNWLGTLAGELLKSAAPADQADDPSSVLGSP